MHVHLSAYAMGLLLIVVIEVYTEYPMEYRKMYLNCKFLFFSFIIIEMYSDDD